MKLVKAQYSKEEVQEILRRAVKQDREFQARVLQNLPLPEENIQQGWIDNPQNLQQVLASVLCPPSEIIVPRLFKAENTNLNLALNKCQEFTKKYLGIEINLRERFAIPVVLPWDSVIPVFDPGRITNRDVVQVLKNLGLDIFEEEDVMKYSGSEANVQPALHFIQNSICPDEDTLGKENCMSPDQLVATNKNWLDLRGYALAFGLYYFVTKKYLDPQTFTWFPNNRLIGGKVAGGDWNPARCRVRFLWDNPSRRDGNGGARLAVPVSLFP